MAEEDAASELSRLSVGDTVVASIRPGTRTATTAKSPTEWQAQRLRRKLVSTATSDVPALEKLGNFLSAIIEVIPLDFCALYVFSRHQWMQLCLKPPRVAGGQPKLSQAHPVPAYSASHQLAEIVREEPVGFWTDYSANSDLPGDLQDLAEREGLSAFRLFGVQDSHGNLCAMLVLGHLDDKLFKQNASGWQLIAEALEPILPEALHAAQLTRYVTFAEMVSTVTCQADMVLLLAKWVPYIIFGTWGGLFDCFVAGVLPSEDEVMMYKAGKGPSTGEAKETRSSRQAAATASRSRNVQRLSSVSSMQSKSLAQNGQQQSQRRSQQDRLLAAVLAPEAVAFGLEAALLPAEVNSKAIVVHKRLRLAGTLAEAVMSGETALCIHDVRQHMNDHPDTHAELLFQVNDRAPGSMLLVPLFAGGNVGGAVYVSSHVRHAMVYKQLELELLMMVVSELVLRVLRGAAAQPARQQGRHPYVGREAAALVRASIGESGHGMQPYAEELNVDKLCRLYLDSISEYSRSEHPQICEPEHIRLESLIGRGAFGVVYKGRLDVLNTVVAIKVMALVPDADAMMLVRSASELAAMRHIRHHNVVQILAQFPDCVLLPESQNGQAACFRRMVLSDLDASTSSGATPPLQRCCVLVMEFCGYGTLLNALQMDAFKNRDGSPNMSLICSVLLEIAAALDYVHSFGIIHCDLKPQNVLLKPDDSNPRGFVTKLADFGLARVITQAIPLLNGDSAGTPSHLAPEIVKFGDQESIKTAKADIYAFGVLMWELLVSRQAFSAVDKQAVLTHVVVQRRRLPLPPTADTGYCDLCRRCWDADMDARPALPQVQVELKAILLRYTVRPPWLTAGGVPGGAVAGDAGPGSLPPPSQAPDLLSTAGGEGMAAEG